MATNTLKSISLETKHEFAPFLSEIVCDKLSITVKTLNHQEDAGIKKTILDLVDTGYGKMRARPMYATSAQLFTGDFNESSILVQCSPKRSGIAGFRAEWSPAHAHTPDVTALLDAVFTPGYYELTQRALCTRIDVTVDIHHASVDEFLFWAPGFQKSASFCKGGRIETYYIGTARSALQFCIYDKVAEIKRKNLDRIIKVPVPDHDVTRIEARIRQRTKLNEIQGIENPLTKINVSRIAGIDPADWQTHLFIRASRAEGTQDTLLVLPKKQRTKVKQLLSSSPAEIWKPKEAWQVWSNIAQVIQNPEPSAFSMKVQEFIPELVPPEIESMESHY